MLVYIKEGLGPLQHVRTSILWQQITPFQKKQKYCSRQIPKNKYSKNAAWMFFSFKVKHAM